MPEYTPRETTSTPTEPDPEQDALLDSLTAALDKGTGPELEAALGAALGIPAEDPEPMQTFTSDGRADSATPEPVCGCPDDLQEDAQQALLGTHSCDIHATLSEQTARHILTKRVKYRGAS